MADPLGPVNPGDDMDITATAWNAAMVAARAHRQPGRPEESEKRSRPAGYLEAVALNDTGAGLEAFKPVKVTGAGGYVINGSEGQAFDWLKRTPLTLDVPSGPSDIIAVTLQPIPDGKFGRVAVAGWCACDVDISSASHGYASPTTDTDALVSGASGSVRIIATGTGTARRTQVYLFSSSPPRRKSPLGMPCLVQDGYGGVAGIAQRWEQADGSVVCEVSGFCEGEDCGPESVPSPPVPPPPVPPVPPIPPLVPPDPAPETYSVWVEVHECEGLTPTGFPYTVTVPGSTEVSQSVTNPPGGAWFTGIPWTTDTSVGIATFNDCLWSVGTVGCGGLPGSSVGTLAPLPGETCDYMAVSFSIGNCGIVAPPEDLEHIAVEAPAVDED